MKTALITGVTGQDGSYISQLLLNKGYQVYGTIRKESELSDWRLRVLGIEHRVKLFDVNLSNTDEIVGVIEITRPDEVYNLAAHQPLHTGVRKKVLRTGEARHLDHSLLTSDINGMAAVRILSILKDKNPDAKCFQASSCQIFGNSKSGPLNEETTLEPNSAYGISKAFAHWMTGNFRETFEMFACSGILFNHESPLRAPEFVTRRISRGVAQIKSGKTNELRLGDLDARRDWGHAADYVDAMWRMLQASNPSDYIIATGETHSVRECCDIAFRSVDLDYRDFVSCDRSLTRTGDAPVMCGNPAKAWMQLGWKPMHSFEEMIREMVAADLDIESK